MAEESDLSRTEPASPRRLQQARNEGDIPRSAELTAWVVLASLLAGLAAWAPHLSDVLIQLFRLALQSAGEPLSAQPFALLLVAGKTILPLLGLIFFVVFLGPMLLSGWVFVPRVLAFDGRRLFPWISLKRAFGGEGFYLVAKTLLKFSLVGVACWFFLSDAFVQLPAVQAHTPDLTLATTSAWMLKGLGAVMGALALIALIDGGWQWWRHRARHAMTWQEVLAEAREAEGSPEMRARMRARQQAAGAASAPVYGQERAESPTEPGPLPSPSPESERGETWSKTVNDGGEFR